VTATHLTGLLTTGNWQLATDNYLVMQDSPRKYTLDPKPPRLGPLPFWLTAILAIAVTVTWIPLSLIARGRFSYSEEPRVQLM
jgi:hypothetical protein